MPRKKREKQTHEREIATTTAGPGMPPEARPIKPPPEPVNRGPSDPVVVSIEGQRSYYTSASLMLASSSVAYQIDPIYQQMMLRDPDVAASSQSLVIEIASLEWSWEADDDEDAAQGELAERLTDIYRRIPRETDMRRNLAMAHWYGSAAVNYQIVRDPETKYAVSGWVPLHPDTLAWDIYGNMAMRVGAKYLTELSTVEIGINSLVHIFDAAERSLIIHNRNFTEAPNFDDARSADQVYRGTGNRDRVWFLWYLKQEVTQNAAIWCKRYAAGIRKGRYASGNDEQQQAVINALSNLINDNNVVLPRVVGQVPDVCDIEIMEPPAAKAAMFMDLINWCSEKIKEVIQGQSLTSTTAGTGMGSGVSDQHANTKSLFIRFLADNLAESVTRDFGWNMGRLLGYPDSTVRRVSFKLATERPNIKERMEAAMMLLDMGAELDEDEVRGIAGWSKPREGATVLRKSMGDPLSGLLGDVRDENAE